MIAAASTDTAELFVYDVIGDEFGGITAPMVAAELSKLKGVRSITVHVNSPGGDAYAGVAIYNLLKDHRATIRVEVDGMAASAASIIAMAGDSIGMHDNSIIMIHEAHGVVVGRAKDMQARAELLLKLNASIVNTYVARTGNSAADVTRWMESELWMSATEALDLGFATDIISAKSWPAYAMLDEKQQQWAEMRARIDRAMVGI